MNDWLRLLAVYIHIISVVIGLGTVIKQDWDLLRRRQYDFLALKKNHHVISTALCMMWVTGLTIITIDTAWVYAELISRPKLMAKLSVVIVLTVNALLIHHTVLPMLNKLEDTPTVLSSWKLNVMCCIGAVSISSWLYAVFLGIAKSVAYIGYTGFMFGYLTLTLCSLIFASTFVKQSLIIRPSLNK